MTGKIVGLYRSSYKDKEGNDRSVKNKHKFYKCQKKWTKNSIYCFNSCGDSDKK